jgi:hypothetical protein
MIHNNYVHALSPYVYFCAKHIKIIRCVLFSFMNFHPDSNYEMKNTSKRGKEGKSGSAPSEAPKGGSMVYNPLNAGKCMYSKFVLPVNNLFSSMYTLPPSHNAQARKVLQSPLILPKLNPSYTFTSILI